MDIKNKIAVALGSCLFIACGVWAIVDPNASEAWTATGRKAWLKEIIIAIWGVPFGITMVVLGGLSLFFLFFTRVSDEIDFE